MTVQGRLIENLNPEWEGRFGFRSDRRTKKNFAWLLLFFCLLFLIWPRARAWALPVGTLLYRTSDQGQMYGYNNPELIVTEQGMVKHIYSGHAAIYVGQENGIDYIVEALGDGVVKNRAEYFVNEALGEKFLGAKIPSAATAEQAEIAAEIAKRIAAENLGYDIDFKKQKGPADGDWTCVGLTEKVYESADIPNPENLGALEYDPAYYGLNITPDGFDKISFYNSRGDCFSKKKEFSKINRETEMLIPFPELIGFAAGLEHEGNRYIFLPYTQFLQPSLKSVTVDIKLSSSFPDEEIRGSLPVWPIVLKWSLINNPISSLKKLASAIFSGSSSEIELVPADTVTALASSSETPADYSEPIAGIENGNQASEASNNPPDLLEIISPAGSKTNTGSDSSAKSASASAKASSTAAITASSTASKASGKAQAGSSQTASPAKAVSATSKAAAVAKAATTTKPTVKNQAASPPPKVIAAVETKAYHPATTTASTLSYIKPANNYTATSNPIIIASSSSSTSPNILDLDPALILPPGHIVISRIGEADSDDWVELFNPYPVEFDLAANNYRLERAKTAVDPSIMIRFGNENDAVFKTTVIAPYGRYLITSIEASQSLKDQAQAISGRSEFSWTKSGYTIYLGQDAISSNLDPDIIDYVGWGEAAYYEGSGPAAALLENYYLSRKALASSTQVSLLEGGAHYSLNLAYDSNNNAYDWLELPVSGKLENPIASSSGNGETDYGLDSLGLVYLKHFDECYQSGQRFVVGKWGCARFLNSQESKEAAAFNPALSGAFSLGFFYKSLGQFPRFYFSLANGNTNESLSISIESGMSEISGLPNIAGRNYDHNFWPDNDWHELVLVVNTPESYWALYQDGKEIYHKAVTEPLPSFNRLDFGGNNGDLAIDEFSVWNRALSLAEIKLINQENLPFRPATPLAPLVPAALANFYGFDENLGSVIHDSVGSNNLAITQNFWYSNGKVGGYIFQDSRQALIAAPLAEINGSDLSLSFWWRNRSYPNEGRVRISLNHDSQAIFGLVAGYYRPAYFFNGEYGLISEGENKTIPYDNEWHHLALAYSARDYLLNFYVDGDLKMSRPYIWIPPGREINRLEISLENYEIDLDELGIWWGTLSATEIKNIYDAQ